MLVSFSSHAINRMREREITKEEVETALRSPQKIAQKDDTFLAIKFRKNGHLLIIIYRETIESKYVITVIDTSKIDKYI